MAWQSPILLPSPGVGQHPSFSGNDLACVQSPRGCIPPLCVSHLVSIPPRDFKHPVPSWCQAALPALVGEEAGDLTLLQVSCGRHWAEDHSNLVPAQIPGTLALPHNLLTVCLSMSSTIFDLQTSYKLGFHLLFTLFLRRLARCSSCVQGELGSAPTYLTTISLSRSDIIFWCGQTINFSLMVNICFGHMLKIFFLTLR